MANLLLICYRKALQTIYTILDLENKIVIQTICGFEVKIADDLIGKQQETLINFLLRLNHFHTDYFEEHYTRKKERKISYG